MKTAVFIIAVVAGLTFAASFTSTARAAPLAGAFVPAVEPNAAPVAQRCWYQADGRLVCMNTGYAYDPAYYRTYGCEPARRPRHDRAHDRDYSDRELAEWPYFFHEFCRPDGYPHPFGFYGGKAFYFGGVW
jgi:hypothetical protein